MNERLAQIMNLQAVILPAWPLLSKELLYQRNEWIEKLVVINDEQVRGRIKAIDLMLQLPVELQQEAISLKTADLAQNAPQQD